MINEGYVKKYCCDDISLIENFDIAINSPDKWECHHRKEIENDRIVYSKELKEQGLYYNRPAEELIFLSNAEHRRLHNLNRSEEERKRISESKKGKVTWNKGKKMSEEQKRKIIEALSKRVLCIETSIIFESASEAFSKTGINQSNISQVCQGKRKTAGGYHWQFV